VTPSEREQRRLVLEHELGEEVTLDGLTRDWTIFQRRRGHRHSTDDLLTAWYAVTKVKTAARLLDLGTGIGSVGLLTLWCMQGATLTAIEAQDVSFRLLRENVDANDLASRVAIVHGDLRHTAIEEETFDLVTGSPPYFDVKKGIVPADSQKAHARFELRGDVRDYCRAARRALAAGGRFVFCFPTVQRARALHACEASHLPIVSMRDVIPKEGTAPLFSLFHCRRVEDDDETPVEVEPPYVVRDANGVQTAEHAASRALFGME
jgi:tRNA1Val (adenine37-N6)-methyltransferase